MALFRISGKLETDGKWSEQQTDFGGYFIRDSKNVIQGYVIERDAKSREQKHFIAGIYENGKIVFVKMLPYSTRSPMCFVCFDLAQNGYWDTFFPINGGFFANSTFQGHCSLSVSNVVDASGEDKVHCFFAEFVENNASTTHLGLLEDVETLRHFWEESRAPHD